MKETPTTLARLVDAARERKLFHRDRVPLEVKAEAVLLYFHGLSLRRVAEHFNRKFGKDSIRQWWRRFSILFNYAESQHAVVVVDETRLHRGRRSAGRSTRLKRDGTPGKYRRRRHHVKQLPPTNVLWVAIDPNSFHVIALRLGRVQTNEDCYEFLAETRHRSHTDPHIIHDRGPWYTSQTKALGLDHAQTRGGLRSRIECWNRQLKHRLDRFWRCWTPNTTLASMETWLRAYSVLWNLTRPTPP